MNDIQPEHDDDDGRNDDDGDDDDGDGGGNDDGNDGRNDGSGGGNDDGNDGRNDGSDDGSDEGSDGRNDGDGDGGEGGDETIGYADAMHELEQILGDLEGDDLDVDMLAARVERASFLIGLCRKRIGAARVQVERVVANLDSEDEAEDD